VHRDELLVELSELDAFVAPFVLDVGLSRPRAR
jgi:hypothetical protein